MARPAMKPTQRALHLSNVAAQAYKRLRELRHLERRAREVEAEARKRLPRALPPDAHERLAPHLPVHRSRRPHNK